MAAPPARDPAPGSPAGWPLAYEMAARSKTALFAGAGVALLLAVASGFAQSLLGSDLPAALSLFGLEVALVFFVAAWTVGLRQETWRARTAAESPGARDPDRGGGADADPAAELARFCRLGAPVVLALGALIALTFMLIALGDRLGALLDAPGAPPAASPRFYAAGSLSLLLVFPFVVFGRALARVPADHLPEAAPLAVWLRAGQWMAGLTGLALIVHGLGAVPFDLPGWISVALLLLAGLAAFEMLVRAVVRLARRRARGPADRAPIESIALTALFRRRNPVDSLLEAAEARLGFTLRTAFALQFVRRSVPPVLLGCGLLLWLSTALVVVRPEEEGVRFRCGRLLDRSAVPPGLALKWPWPLETIQRFPARRVGALALGFAGARRTALLWTEAHAGVEYKQLLGDGRELVSVDGQVSYRIRDVIAYALQTQNPAEILDALASRVLMHKTVTTDLDTLLSVDRARFSADFAQSLQAEVDRMDLGIEILQVSFESLHPPVRIAPEYQAVVGAEIARDTLVIRAEVERAADLPRAQAEVRTGVLAAEADGRARVARSRGDAARYRAGVEAYRAAPELFRFRRRMEALEEGLAGLAFLLLDHELDPHPEAEGTGRLWLDLRSEGSKPSRRP